VVVIAKVLVLELMRVLDMCWGWRWYRCLEWCWS